MTIRFRLNGWSRLSKNSAKTLEWTKYLYSLAVRLQSASIIFAGMQVSFIDLDDYFFSSQYYIVAHNEHICLKKSKKLMVVCLVSRGIKLCLLI